MTNIQWDRSLPLLSCKWLEAASGNRWHQFRTNDRTTEAIHKAKKTIFRRCAEDVKVYETAIMKKDSEITHLRNLLKEAQNNLIWLSHHTEVLKYQADMSEDDESHLSDLLHQIKEATL